MRADVLILSSLVAAGEVGGGTQAAILAAAGVTPGLVPTVLFGRHPGYGAPGGGATPTPLFAGMLEGVRAAAPPLKAILAGYFATPEQVEAAAAFIAGRAPGCLNLVDPIMGDAPGGLYVSEAAAEAITTRLVPAADVITPNLWELARLGVADWRAAAQNLGRTVIVTSATADPREIGVGLATGDGVWLIRYRRVAEAPKGTGDRLAAHFLAERMRGLHDLAALEIAVADLAERLTGERTLRVERQ